MLARPFGLLAAPARGLRALPGVLDVTAPHERHQRLGGHAELPAWLDVPDAGLLERSGLLAGIAEPERVASQ
jgi:hypothetical protein